MKVFEQTSRGDNMILQIVPSDTPNFDELATRVLGKSMFVSWPHLVEAQVIGLSTREVKVSLSNSRGENFVREDVKGALLAQWQQSKKAIAEK